MANNITVTTATLKAKAEELRTTNSSLKTQIENLQTEEGTLNSMWDGDANDAFHAVFMNDLNQMTQFYNAIENYCTALEQIAAQYDSTEAANQSIINARTY